MNVLLTFAGTLGLIVCLAIALLLIDRALSRYAQSDSWPAYIHRFYPLGALALLGIAGILLLGQILLEGGPFAYAVLAISAIVLFSLQRPLRDVLSGAWLRAEGTLRPGAMVSVGRTRGRVRLLGVRSFEMDGGDGSLNRIPYGVAMRGRLSLAASEGGVGAHAFVLDLPAHLSESARESVRLAVLNHPCTPVRRAPLMRLVGGPGDRAALEVTVYAATAEHAGRIEAYVRRTSISSQDA